MTHAVLFDMGISPDAKPGRYTGQLSIESAGSSALAPFSLIVHKTVVREYALDSTHWFWPSPEYLTTELQPEWWSEKHWKLIENSGHRLAEYGQNVILTPLVEGAHPLVQTRLSSTGAYTFDFSQFERWVHLFLSLGFEKIEGAHLTTRAGISSKDIFAYDERSGKTKQIFEESHSPADQEAWLDYLAKFLDALYAELEAKQWTSLYLQHIADEPSGEEQHLINYKLFREMVNRHLPGIPTLDAIWSDPTPYSSSMDIPAMAIMKIPSFQPLVAARKQEGKTTWIYNFCKPYPPLPNRWLDMPLSNSRLYPLLAFKYQATGYLFWAANLYRGADPYKRSIGPVGHGAAHGHSVGDNWLYYPGPKGLRGSMKMLAFREGLMDHALLTRLAEKDRTKSNGIIESVARSLTDYATEPQVFHAARKDLLVALDEYPD